MSIANKQTTEVHFLVHVYLLLLLLLCLVLVSIHCILVIVTNFGYNLFQYLLVFGSRIYKFRLVNVFVLVIHAVIVNENLDISLTAVFSSTKISPTHTYTQRVVLIVAGDQRRKFITQTVINHTYHHHYMRNDLYNNHSQGI